MLKIIKKDFIYEDRHRFLVSRIEGKREFVSQKNTRFIFLKGKIDSKNALLSGFVAAATNEDFIADGHGIVIDLLGYNNSEQFFCLVNPGSFGHLSYIDGCSNSNLISPSRNGDPCLNYLYFPKNTLQTFHVHPSVRIGMILSGEGTAELEDSKHNLMVGDCFLLDRFTRHRFYTNDSHMSLIAFHPDSDDGPSDEYNPMKSRTYISK